MTTSAIGTTLDALVAGLRARPALYETGVYSGDMALDKVGTRAIVLADCTLNEEEMAMGGYRWEVWDIGGALIVNRKTWEGDDEATIKAARDEALDLLAEIEEYLGDTYTEDLPDVSLVAGDMQQYPSPEGRVCSITFTLRMKADKQP